MKTASFDKNNSLALEGPYQNGILYSGLEVSFYILNNYIQVITHYENGKYINTSYYDVAGVLRVDFKRKPIIKSFFMMKTENKLTHTITSKSMVNFLNISMALMC